MINVSFIIDCFFSSVSFILLVKSLKLLLDNNHLLRPLVYNYLESMQPPQQLHNTNTTNDVI